MDFSEKDSRKALSITETLTNFLKEGEKACSKGGLIFKAYEREKLSTVEVDVSNPKERRSTKK